MFYLKKYQINIFLMFFNDFNVLISKILKNILIYFQKKTSKYQAHIFIFLKNFKKFTHFIPKTMTKMILVSIFTNLTYCFYHASISFILYSESNPTQKFVHRRKIENQDLFLLFPPPPSL
jgi:hypothetical protein